MCIRDRQPHWNLGNGLSTLVAGETPNMSLSPRCDNAKYLMVGIRILNIATLYNLGKVVESVPLRRQPVFMPLLSSRPFYLSKVDSSHQYPAENHQDSLLHPSEGRGDVPTSPRLAIQSRSEVEH